MAKKIPTPREIIIDLFTPKKRKGKPACPNCGNKITRIFAYDDKYVPFGYLTACSYCGKMWVLTKDGKVLDPFKAFKMVKEKINEKIEEKLEDYVEVSGEK